MNLSKQILGSSLSLPAYGREGQGQNLSFWRRISQSEIRNSAAEKSESESEGGRKFLPPTPFLFARLSVQFGARSAAIIRRVSLRKKPCISELNRKVGQIQIQFFGKANGGSACKARNKQSLFPIFSFPPEAEHKASFLIPRFCARGEMAKGDLLKIKE